MNTESKKVFAGEGVKFETYPVALPDTSSAPWIVFNNMKRAEVEDRVKHCKIGCCCGNSGFFRF